MTDITPIIPKTKQIITAYGGGGFTIGERRYDSSVIVFPDRTVLWDGADFSAIIAEKNKIEILLFGSGAKIIFPAAEVFKELKSAGIALETMDSGAACRTYNILLAEERKVACALVAV